MALRVEAEEGCKGADYCSPLHSWGRRGLEWGCSPEFQIQGAEFTIQVGEGGLPLGMAQIMMMGLPD